MPIDLSLLRVFVWFLHNHREIRINSALTSSSYFARNGAKLPTFSHLLIICSLGSNSLTATPIATLPSFSASNAALAPIAAAAVLRNGKWATYQTNIARLLTLLCVKFDQFYNVMWLMTNHRRESSSATRNTIQLASSKFVRVIFCTAKRQTYFHNLAPSQRLIPSNLGAPTHGGATFAPNFKWCPDYQRRMWRPNPLQRQMCKVGFRAFELSWRPAQQ